MSEQTFPCCYGVPDSAVPTGGHKLACTVGGAQQVKLSVPAPDPRAEIWAVHKGSAVTFPLSMGLTVRDAKLMADEAAHLGHEVLYRAFAQQPDGSVRFVTAWSVLGGVVREHCDVTIPAAHW